MSSTWVDQYFVKFKERCKGAIHQSYRKKLSYGTPWGVPPPLPWCTVHIPFNPTYQSWSNCPGQYITWSIWTLCFPVSNSPWIWFLNLILGNLILLPINVTFLQCFIVFYKLQLNLLSLSYHLRQSLCWHNQPQCPSKTMLFLPSVSLILPQTLLSGHPLE
jgi:hypothetical protein